MRRVYAWIRDPVRFLSDAAAFVVVVVFVLWPRRGKHDV